MGRKSPKTLPKPPAEPRAAEQLLTTGTSPLQVQQVPSWPSEPRSCPEQPSPALSSCSSGRLGSHLQVPSSLASQPGEARLCESHIPHFSSRGKGLRAAGIPLSTSAETNTRKNILQSVSLSYCISWDVYCCLDLVPRIILNNEFFGGDLHWSNIYINMGLIKSKEKPAGIPPWSSETLNYTHGVAGRSERPIPASSSVLWL